MIVKYLLLKDGKNQHCEKENIYSKGTDQTVEGKVCTDQSKEQK